MKKSFSIIIYITLLTFSFVIDVEAKTVVENASVCELNEIYRDADKIEDALGKKEYLDETVGNTTYCPVYCVEEDVFTFPGFRPVVNSGGHFTWTIGETVDENILLGYTVNLKGRRNCRTKLNLDKWINDYNSILSHIQSLISQLKVPLQTETVCPPNLGSRGCGYKLDTDFGLTDAGAPTSWINAGGLSNYISQESNGGSKLRIHEHFALLDSNRFMNVYQFDPGSLWDANGIDGVAETEVGIAIRGNSYWMEHQIKYQTLCPCEWRNESEASEAEVGANTAIGNVTAEVFDKVCASSNDEINSEISKYIGKTSPSVPNTIVPFSRPISTLQCSNAHGGSKSSCNDSIWGVHESQTEEQAVRTKVGCQISGRIQLTYEEKTRAVPNGRDYRCITTGTVHGSSASCKNSCTAGMCVPITKYKTETYYEITGGHAIPSSVQRKITSIQQEKCVGIKGMNELTKKCITGTSCPAGYHIGSDGMCNKTNTSELRTYQEKQKYMLDILKNCSDWDVNYYDLDTDAYIDYEEPIYSRTEKMDRKLLSESYEENHRIMAKDDTNLESQIRYWSNSGASIAFYVCDLGSSSRECVRQTRDYSKYWISEYGKQYQKEFGYYLPQNFYRYVLLPIGKSVDSVPEGSEYEKYNRFIDIGYSNYPVHYSTPHREPYYNLDVIFDKVGYQSKFSNDVYHGNYEEIDGQQVETIEYNGKKLLYDCEYNVEEGEPYCPTTGCGKDEYELGSVRIIYRPISLENPFSSMDGDGRNTGNNWCIINDDKEDCSNHNDNVENYILNNRNTEGSRIYFEREPMYQITLNPSLIKQIRNYNSRTNYDDYNLSCSTVAGEEGTECRSHFVVGGMEETDLPSLKDYISGCGTDNDWYACDKLDNYER